MDNRQMFHGPIAYAAWSSRIPASAKYQRWDSNPHVLNGHWILNYARLDGARLGATESNGSAGARIFATGGEKKATLSTRGAAVTLQEYICRYNLQNDIKPATLEHYEWVVHSLQSFEGTVRTRALSDDLLNRWLLWLREKGLSPFTIHSRRNSLLVIWRSAYRDGVAPRPGEIRRIRLPDPAKAVWTGEEITRLVKSCLVLKGRFRGVRLSRSDYFSSIIQAAYDTGLRQSDLHRVTVESVTSGNRMGILQQKTGRCVVVRLHEATLQAVREFASDPPRQFVWPRWSKRRGTFARTFRQVVKAAGVTGTFGTLRKTSGTEVERQAIGAGWLHLGHCSPDTARRWYINSERAYDVDRPLPPPLPL